MPISCHFRACKALLVTYSFKKRCNKYRDLYLYLFTFLLSLMGLGSALRRLASWIVLSGYFSANGRVIDCAFGSGWRFSVLCEMLATI